MRLSINDEKVSYSLEHERTLGEVVHGIRSWLASAGFVITKLEADGDNLLTASGTEWGTRGVEAVSDLSVRATHTGDIRIAHWKVAEQWLGMLGDALDRLNAAPAADGQDPLEELMEDLPRTLDGFEANPFARTGSEDVQRFRQVFHGAQGAQVRSWSVEERRKAAELVRRLEALVGRRLEDAAHPEGVLKSCAGQLRSSMGELKEVSLLLQTGRDRPAMEAIIRFADVAQSIMDVLPFLPPDLDRSRLVVELTPVLKELVGAFDSRDSVLIGDLLEYEVAPRLEKLAPLLGRAR